QGLVGYSDGDALVHAIIDAIIGATSSRDIGFHFPTSSPEYEGISSLKLLKNIGELLHLKGYTVGNIDSTVVAEAPKLTQYVSDMCFNISSVLGIPKDSVNVKAKTEEGLGYIGKKKGIAAYAVCLLHKAT
ncbi:2-C-methyl-D-erythritol 2,4-cyclodiphosphate synthase, partial [Candidatus Margulisiibacteriota bacterium]